MVSPQAVICVKVITNSFTLACIILRFWILRANGVRTLHSNICHCLLLSASILDFTATGLSVWVVCKEIKLRKLYSGAELDAKMVTEANSRVFWFSHLFYYIAILVIKSAYLVFYAQLYKNITSRRRFALPVAVAVWLGNIVVGFVVLSTWCQPFTDNWNPATTHPHCPTLFNLTAFRILSISNIVSDLAILVVPLLVVAAIATGSRLERRGLVVIFLIGITSITSSLVRLFVVAERFEVAPYTWTTLHDYMLWSHAEVFFGVLAFTLPGFRFLVVRLKEKFQGTKLAELSAGTLGSRHRPGAGAVPLDPQGSSKASKRDSGPYVSISERDTPESQEDLTRRFSNSITAWPTETSPGKGTHAQGTELRNLHCT